MWSAPRLVADMPDVVLLHTSGLRWVQVLRSAVAQLARCGVPSAGDERERVPVRRRLPRSRAPQRGHRAQVPAFACGRCKSCSRPSTAGRSAAESNPPLGTSLLPIGRPTCCASALLEPCASTQMLTPRRYLADMIIAALRNEAIAMLLSGEG